MSSNIEQVQETKAIDDSIEKVIEDTRAFLTLGIMYSETSKYPDVIGYAEKVTKARELFDKKKYSESYDILADIYQDELRGIRDREFKWCIRDGMSGVSDVIAELQPDKVNYSDEEMKARKAPKAKTEEGE